MFRTCVSCHVRSLYVCLSCTLFRMHVSCHVMPLYVCLCQSVFRMNISRYTRSFPNNSAHLISPVPSSGFRNVVIVLSTGRNVKKSLLMLVISFNPYPTAFPYGNGMVLHFYQQQESSTTKTVHRVINKRLKAYV